MMTITLPALWTRAPITGSNTPVMARTIATKLSAIENVRLHLIVTIMRFERLRRWGNADSSDE